MKVITIFGRLTKNGEVRQTDTGKFVTFSVAVNEGYGENQTAIFFDVAYNREGIAPYLTKGKKVVASGSLDIVDKDGRTFYNIRANQVEFAGDAKPREQVQHTEHSAPSPQMQPAMAEMDDEIPF